MTYKIVGVKFRFPGKNKLSQSLPKIDSEFYFK